MSNTIRLTSMLGQVRWGKSLTTDFQRIADRTGIPWIAQDIDWPERDDYPRWYVPRSLGRPRVEWIGSVIIDVSGEVTFPGPLTDEQLRNVMEAGGISYSERESRVYIEDEAVLHTQYIDWTQVR